MDLRKNQVEPVKLGIDFFSNKKPVPSIIVAPTAFGKSIVIASIAKGVNDKLVILQPTKELLEQNYSKYIALGGEASVYSASFNSKVISDVTYATIGSIKSIGARFKELGFTKMIIDECHLYPRNMDSMLGGFLKDSNISHVLGLTATPIKLQTNMNLDGSVFSKLVMLTSRSKQGNFFKEIIYVSQVQEMIELGFWSKLEYQQYDVDETNLVYNSTQAEFTDESIKLVYEANNTEQNIINKLSELSDRKSIIIFVPTVADALHFAEIVPNASAVYGDMNTKERDRVITGFKSLKIRVIFNVNVLSVGFDHPQLDCIIMARSTASLSWYYQALGRGTRIHELKKDCLIVDFSGNVKRFGKVESLYFKKERIWKLYGEGGKLLTGCPINEIGLHFETSGSDLETETKDSVPKIITMPYGKFKGKEIKDLEKGYRKWMYETWEWNKYNMAIKNELEKIMMEEIDNG